MEPQGGQVKIAMTGHRPEKIKSQAYVRHLISDAFMRLQPEVVIQGMAAGVDLWSAKAAKDLGIPFWCIRPWAGHSPRKADILMYQGALQDAELIHNVSMFDKYPGPYIYQRRNEFMVDHADLVFAVWDGSKGGTYNCLMYAEKQGKQIYRLDPNTQEFSWL